jgi:hypothetical protein
MEIIAIIVSILCITGIAVYTNFVGLKAERERYREFVRSTKANTLQEYEEVIQEEAELPAEEDILEDLSELDEEILIKKLHESNELKQDEY